MLDMAKKRFIAVAKRYGGVTKKAKFNRKCVERMLASVKDYVEPSLPAPRPSKRKGKSKRPRGGEEGEECKDVEDDDDDDDDDVDADGEEGEECGDNAEDNEKGGPTLQTRVVCMDLFVSPHILVSFVHVSAQ